VSKTFVLNNVQFVFDAGGEPGSVKLVIESKEFKLTVDNINAEQADTIGNVFKAVARTRGFKE
jgi:hypothetical protein